MHRSTDKDDQTRATLKDLQRIPSIGPSLARDLFDLGIRRVSDLRRRKAEKLYDALIELRGVHQDRCVLYTFRCATYFASTPNPEPERLKWWNWQDGKAATARTAPKRGKGKR